MGDRVPVELLDPAGGTPGQVPTINAAGTAVEYATPSGGPGGGSGGTGRDRRWTPSAGATLIDEFNDDTLDPAWVRVDGTGALAANVSWREAGDTLGFTNAGADSTAYHAILRPIATPLAVGDAITTCLQLMGPPGVNFSVMGLMLADGTTFGAGTQLAAWSYIDGSVQNQQKNHLRPLTGFNSAGSFATGLPNSTPGVPVYVRLVKLAGNVWRHDLSVNGEVWLTGGTVTSTFTPTHAGIFNTSFTGTSKFMGAAEFIRRHSGVS